MTPDAVTAIAEQARVRVLRWFARNRLIDRDAVREMFVWENGGFSVHAAVCRRARSLRHGAPEAFLC